MSILLSALFLAAGCRGRGAEPAPAAASLSVWQLEGRWTRASGGEIELASLRGEPALLLLFYGSCEYACPKLVGDLQEVDTRLARQIRERLHYILVTIDPERDTPERLAAYAREKQLDPARWILLHGSAEQVRELAAAVGVRYRAGGAGQFSHTMRILLLDRDGVELQHWDGLDVRLEQIVRAVSEATGRG